MTTKFRFACIAVLATFLGACAPPYRGDCDFAAFASHECFNQFLGVKNPSVADLGYVEVGGNTQASLTESALRYQPLIGDVANPAAEVLIGTAAVFADNLAAGAMMGGAISHGRPLLLNDRTDGVSPQILDEIARVTNGAADVVVHLLGGVNAQGDGVVADLEAEGHTVNRLAGPTRLETAVAIASQTDNDKVMIVRAFPSAGAGDPTQAFADSLTAGGVAATLGYDILFSQTEVLSTSTANHLAAGGYDQALIVGGTAALAQEVEDAVTALIPDTRRVAGNSRFETHIALNDLRPQPLSPTAILVEGTFEDGWASAFPAANFSGLTNAPILLTAGGIVPEPTLAYLEAHYGDSAGRAGGDGGVALTTFGQEFRLVRRWSPTFDDRVRTALDIIADRLGVSDTFWRVYTQTGEEPERVTSVVELGQEGTCDDIRLVTDQRTIDIGAEPGPDEDRLFAINAIAVDYCTFVASLSVGQPLRLEIIPGGSDRVATRQTARDLLQFTSLVSEPVSADVVDVDLSRPPMGVTEGGSFGVMNASTAIPTLIPEGLRIPSAHEPAFIGSERATMSEFEADLSEGDLIEISAPEGSEPVFTLTNRDVTGLVAELEHGLTTTFTIDGRGDDPESDQDALFEADADDDLVLNGDMIDQMTFDEALAEGDEVTYSREGGVERFELTKVLDGMAPPPDPLTGIVTESYNGDGTAPFDAVTLAEGAQRFTIADYNASMTQTNYIVDGNPSSELEFEAAVTPGDGLSYTPEDEPSMTVETVELTNYVGFTGRINAASFRNNEAATPLDDDCSGNECTLDVRNLEGALLYVGLSYDSGQSAPFYRDPPLPTRHVLSSGFGQTVSEDVWNDKLSEFSAATLNEVLIRVGTVEDMGVTKLNLEAACNDCQVPF